MQTPLEHAMTQQALARAGLKLRLRDGQTANVPEGAVEVEFGHGMATLRWKDEQDKPVCAVISPDDYERLVAAGMIRPSVN